MNGATRSRAVCYLGLGSNLGDRAENLHRARSLLEKIPDVRVARASSVYETAPVGVTDQPPFLNQVLEVETGLAPEHLLRALLELEQAMGRVRRERWGPRVIDIDLLLYDQDVVELPHLTLPHPRMKERGFVMVPLAELAPDLILPGGERAADLAEKWAAAGPAMERR